MLDCMSVRQTHALPIFIDRSTQFLLGRREQKLIPIKDRIVINIIILIVVIIIIIIINDTLI